MLGLSVDYTHYNIHIMIVAFCKLDHFKIKLLIKILKWFVIHGISLGLYHVLLDNDSDIILYTCQATE